MDCLFCKIAQKTMASHIEYEDESVMIFHDITPQAPVHLLVIPKQHITTINEVSEADQLLIGKMHYAAKNAAERQGIAEDGYRLVFNVNPQGGQAVYHIHLHVLGGRQMTWPPG